MVAASINFSSIVTTLPTVQNRSFTYFILASLAFLLQIQVILSWIAIAVLGIARKYAILFFTMSSISLISPPVTTEINILSVVKSFFIPFNTSSTWKGFTANMITSLFLTAELLSFVISIPFSFSNFSVEIFLLVIVS